MVKISLIVKSNPPVLIMKLMKVDIIYFITKKLQLLSPKEIMSSNANMSPGLVL